MAASTLDGSLLSSVKLRPSYPSLPALPSKLPASARPRLNWCKNLLNWCKNLTEAARQERNNQEGWPYVNSSCFCCNPEKKNWTVHGLYWGSYKIHQPNVLEDSMKELLSWLSKGLIFVNISHAYNLSQANIAFAAIKERKAIGKVLITIENTGTNSKL